MNKPFIRIVAAAALALAIGPAVAVDTYTTGPADSLATARTHIAAGKWSAAIDELKKVNETGNANWNNLMGFAHRKAGTPDFAAAERYYNEALRIEPKHRGALEYSGELYLMTNDLAKAEQRLAALDKACFLPCDEFKLLKRAVESYKANGNKYVAAQ